MAFRDIPRNLDDKKDVESWFRALRDKVTRIFKHSELDDIRGADKDSVDTTKDKHISDYDLKKINDHMDDDGKHIGTTLSNTSNYLSNISAASNKIAIASPTASTRTIDVDPDKLGSGTPSQYNFLCGDESWKNAIGECSNLGTGQGVYASAVNNFTARFKSLKAGTNVTISATTDEITINAGSYTAGRNINITGTTISLEMQSGCDVDRSSTQSINSGGTTVIQYNNENYDYYGEYDTSTYRFTAALGGRYMVTVAVGLTGITTNKLVEVLIKKNGAEVAQNGTRAGDSGSGSADVRLQVTRFVSLAIGDYIEGAVYHEHGSARNTIAESDTTYMSIAFIG